ncbi:DUF3180 domain-containing protein [Georgenia wutianyii]|uniref:DUF3180 domain-containing protein n=2 Tax=Georgenia wutianyii TaxID=2585135 RepID=A0ABX5VT10_9MICO|nr:DUF3180 domain-containing protein [Georgenia wutianyii]
MMQRTSRQTLLLTAVVAGAVAYAALAVLESRGGALVPVPPVTGIGLLALAVVLLALGRSVRRLVEGKDTRMTQLGAARVAMLAKASSLSGSALGGYFAAQVLLAWRNITAPALREHALSAGGALLACLALVAVALVVEHWCRLPPEEDGEPA